MQGDKVLYSIIIERGGGMPDAPRADLPARAEEITVRPKRRHIAVAVYRGLVGIDRGVAACKRHPQLLLVAAIALLMTSLFIWAAINPPPEETPAQAQARVAAQQAEAHRQAEASARVLSLCELQSVCLKYGVARQACAPAGNYDQCMGIKMGGNFWRVANCTYDGDVRNPPADMPTRVECCLRHPTVCLQRD